MPAGKERSEVVAAEEFALADSGAERGRLPR